MPAPLPTPAPLPAQLDALIHDLDMAVTLPMDDVPAAVAAALGKVGEPDDVLHPFQQAGNTERYTRHVVHSHRYGRYTLVALIWQPGQRTPAHGHHTWCAYRVLAGHLQEERFGWDAERRVAGLEEIAALTPNDCFSAHAGLAKIHRLSNVGQTPAISLHVYGVDADHVATHVNHVVSL